MTTKIILENLWARFEGINAELDNFLRYRAIEPGILAHLKRQGKVRRQWDGYIQLSYYSTAKDYTRFPSGLVPLVIKQPWAQSWDVLDTTVQPARLNTMPENVQVSPWSPDQEEAVEAALVAKRGVIKYPTGTGKGRIIGEVVRRLDVPTLILVDKRDLLTQLGQQIAEAINQSIGIIGDGVYHPADYPSVVTVATFQTLARRLNDTSRQKAVLDDLQKFHAVIVDEAHHAAAKTFEEVLQALPNAYFRLGFSATPFRSYAGKTEDKATFLRVQAWLGPAIAEMSIAQGQETGRIVKPDIYIIHGCIWDAVSARINWLGKEPNYKEERQSGIVANTARNAAITFLAEKLSRSGPTVVLCEQLDHGYRIADACHAPFVSGGIAPSRRQGFYEAFKRQELPLLVISKIADEALDLPNIQNLILAGGGRAAHRQIQRIGRGLRASTGKQTVSVFDWEDYGKYIGSHYRRRRRAYDAEAGYNVIDIELNELEALL